MAGRKPITMCTETEWRDMCRRVRATIPPPSNYSWRFSWSRSVVREGAHGTCNLVPGRGCCTTCGQGPMLGTAHIKVARGMSRSETEATLLHEVAHAFDRWHPHPWQGDHHDDFYLWLGRVERRYHGQETG